MNLSTCEDQRNGAEAPVIARSENTQTSTANEELCAWRIKKLRILNTQNPFLALR